MASEWLSAAAEVFSAVGTVGAFLLGFILLRREHRREAERSEDERRAQAARISAWIEAHRRPDGTRELLFHIHNASDMPIYDVALPLPTPGDDGTTEEFIGLVPPGQTIRRPAPVGWLRTYVEPEPVQIEFSTAPAGAGRGTNREHSPGLIGTIRLAKNRADRPHRGRDVGSGLADRHGDHIGRAVPCEDLGQPDLDADRHSVGAGGHVAVQERIAHQSTHFGEVARQVVVHTAVPRLDQRAGVVCDESAQGVVGVLDVAEIAGAVQRVKPGRRQLRRVSDVMQPSGGDERFSVIPDDVSDALGLAADALCVRPPAR